GLRQGRGREQERPGKGPTARTGAELAAGRVGPAAPAGRGQPGRRPGGDAALAKGSRPGRGARPGSAGGPAGGGAEGVGEVGGGGRGATGAGRREVIRSRTPSGCRSGSFPGSGGQAAPKHG